MWAGQATLEPHSTSFDLTHRTLRVLMGKQRERIRAANQVDIALYELAVELFGKRWGSMRAQLPEGERDLSFKKGKGGRGFKLS